MRDIPARPQMQGPQCLVVDATGVGAPVVDLLRSAGLQVLLESGELKIAGGMRQRAALVRELVDVQMTRAGLGVRSGRDSMTIWRSRWRWRRGRESRNGG